MHHSPLSAYLSIWNKNTEIFLNTVYEIFQTTCSYWYSYVSFFFLPHTVFSSRFSFCLTFYFLARFPLIFLHRLIFLLVLIFPLLIFLHIHFSPNLPLLNYMYFHFLKIASSIFQGLFPLILLHVYIFPLNFLHVLIFSFEIRHFLTFFSSYFSSDLPQCFYFFNVIYLLYLFLFFPPISYVFIFLILVMLFFLFYFLLVLIFSLYIPACSFLCLPHIFLNFILF